MQGNLDAQQTLGVIYNSHPDISRDLHKSLKWHLLAAEQGDTDSQVAVGMMLISEGIPHNYDSAFSWFQRAAVRENRVAQSFLADCYFLGQGVEADPAEAIIWLRRSAENGYPSAQYMLGYFYSTEGVLKRNDLYAYMWFSLAEEAGYEEAISEKALLIAMMSQKDLGIAKTLFQSCAENDLKDCETLQI